MNVGTILIIIAAALVTVAVAFVVYRMARRTDRLKYEFVTIIAHKFRTPLTTIKWSVESLAEGETDPYKKQSLADIKKAGDGLIDLVGTLVELTDTDGAAYKLERLNLCALAKTAVENAKNDFHNKNQFISVVCSAKEIPVRADAARISFVLETLLSNACAYSSPGRNIAVSVWADANKASVSVSDNGIGIDPYDMRHIFTKFYRAKNARAVDTEGFGVGLYLARSVVKRHHGKLEAYSEGLNKGATFSIVLPRAR